MAFFLGDDGVGTPLDHFSVIVRGCKPMQPEGFEITLELRRVATGNPPPASTADKSQTAQPLPAKERGGDGRAA
jgi:hypothetical protein